VAVWSLQDIVSFKAFVHERIIPVLPLPIRISHTIPILLHDGCAIYDPPAPPLLYTIHHTTLVLAMSCKGQVAVSLDCLFLFV